MEITAVTMKSSSSWDMTPCSLVKVSEHFGGTYRFHLQGRTVSQARNQHILTFAWRDRKTQNETSIYHSRIICFPGSVVQFLWSLSESYFNYGSRIYCFPGSIVSFSDPQQKRWIEVSLYLSRNNWSSGWDFYTWDLLKDYPSGSSGLWNGSIIRYIERFIMNRNKFWRGLWPLKINWHLTCYLHHAGFLRGLFFDPEDGGDMFLWNISWF
jgi:hypothetical protein